MSIEGERNIDMEKYTKKLVAVLNEKVEIGTLMNALAHMSVGLGASIEDKDGLRLVDYTDGDGKSHTNLSELPFIILRGSSNKMKALREELIAKKVQFVDFPDFVGSMGTFDNPLKSRKFKEPDIKYYGITMYGDWDVVSELTRKFSLWK